MPGCRPTERPAVGRTADEGLCGEGLVMLYQRKILQRRTTSHAPPGAGTPNGETPAPISAMMGR